MIIDFRKKDNQNLNPIKIRGDTIETKNEYKYLGLTISDNLTWEKNSDAIRKKAMKKLYCLRILKKFNLSTNLLELFYNSIIASTLTFGITIWGAGISKESERKLDKIRKTATKVIGSNLKTLCGIHTSRTLRLANKILKDDTHPLSSHFELLPSRRRYRTPRTRTNRLKQSFIPCAIKLLNSQSFNN
jgi:hypothetical protein